MKTSSEVKWVDSQFNLRPTTDADAAKEWVEHTEREESGGPRLPKYTRHRVKYPRKAAKHSRKTPFPPPRLGAHRS